MTRPSPTAELFGSYQADVTRPQRLAGRWGLELRGNGSVVVTAPAGYAGVVSGTIFTADRSRLRINLFAQDVCSDLGNGEYDVVPRGRPARARGQRRPVRGTRSVLLRERVGRGFLAMGVNLAPRVVAVTRVNHPYNREAPDA